MEDVCGDGALSSRLRDKLKIDANSISLWTRLIGCRLYKNRRDRSVGQLGPWRDNHVVTLSETIVDEVVLEAALFETRSRELRALNTEEEAQ